MQKVILSTCFILITSIVGSQTLKLQSKVMDENKMGLPYTNIYVLGQTIGTSSNIDGDFELILNDSLKYDSLVFSSIGYQARKIAIEEIKDTFIELKKQTTNVEEIVVTPYKYKGKEIAINRFSKKKCYVQYEQVVTDWWIPSRPKEPSIEAMFFPYKDEYSNNYLKEVHLFMSNFNNKPSYFMLRLFIPNKRKAPGDDIIPEYIKVEVFVGRSLLKFDLSKYLISIPKNGIFIGVELLIIEENRFALKNNADETIFSYSPFLNYVRSKKEESYWLYSKGKWNQEQKKVISGFITKKSVPDSYIKPAISLVIGN